MQYSPSSAAPVALSASVQSKVYGLFALAMALTLVGTFVGMNFAQTILSSGMHLALALVELGLIFIAGWWSRKEPLNYILFAAFPFLSGITITPYLLYVLQGYVNGSAILFNALVATFFMSLAAIVLARIAPRLAVIGRALFFAVIGLLVLSLMQLFIPALQTQGAELLISGFGVVVFGLFAAFDLQRISRMSTLGANPFLLALSLYLDIFNLFLYVLRFMMALSGERR